MFERAPARDGAHLQPRNVDRLRVRDWLLLGAMSAACAALFYYVSRLLGWPVFPGFCGSLLAGAATAAGIAAAFVGLCLCAALSTLLVGRIRYEAGLLTASIGLAALAVRGGDASALLRTTGKPQVYLVELLETIMLLGLTGLAWQLLSMMSKFGWLAREPADPSSDVRSKLPRQIMATLVQAVVTGLMMFLLARTDNSKQVIAAVAVASLLGSIAAHQSFPVRPSVPFWAGPFVTAIIGYAWALAAPGQWAIGLPANALASATPLHYASVGAAGAILGYWASRQWQGTEDDKVKG